jgi:hypothetical protein
MFVPAAGLLARHIDLGEFRLAASLRDLFHRRRALLGIAPRQHDGRARRSESFGHAKPDATIATSDDGHAARQIEQAHSASP